METRIFHTTEIINLFMVDKLFVFFSVSFDSIFGLFPKDAERHDHYEMYYIDTGELDLQLDDEVVKIKAGQCLILEPYTTHKVLANVGNTALKLSGFKCKGDMLFPLCKKPITLTDDERSLLCEIVEDGSACFEKLPEKSGELGYKVPSGISQGRLQSLKNKLEIFLIKLIELRYTVKNAPERSSIADSIYSYLCEHVTDKVTLEQIAKELSLSVSYIKKVFSKKYGRGIIDCLLDMKITRAKQLIEETSLNFTQIADYLSFDSENHFLKTFLKRTGKTPTAYSKQVKNTQEEIL